MDIPIYYYNLLSDEDKDLIKDVLYFDDKAETIMMSSNKLISFLDSCCD